jgi:predicted nucleic acid-binding protein
MTYLVDSDILIYYFKKKEPFLGIVESILTHSTAVMSAITLTEVRAGWDDAHDKKLLPVITDLFPVIDVSFTIAENAGHQIKRCSQRGRMVTTTDGIIAATALINGLCLVTNNKDDFPISELQLYNLTP